MGWAYNLLTEAQKTDNGVWAGHLSMVRDIDSMLARLPLSEACPTLLITFYASYGAEGAGFFDL